MVVCAAAACGQTGETAADLAQRYLPELIRLDSTNPPGNEARSAAFFKRVFDAEGIENQVFEIAPGRANIWARLAAKPGSAGTQKQRPLVLNVGTL